MSRERCAGRGCRHSRSAHDEAGRCAWCVGTGRCRGWAARRRHLWRETCWEVWFGAHHRWWLAREAACIGYHTEERDFEAAHPQPTFKETLIGLAGGATWST